MFDFISEVECGGSLNGNGGGLLGVCRQKLLQDSLLVGDGIGHVVNINIYFLRMLGVTPVTDLGGFNTTVAALALPNWFGLPQAWICLCNPSCASINVVFHSNHILFAGILFPYSSISGIKAWACSMDFVEMATRVTLGMGSCTH